MPRTCDWPVARKPGGRCGRTSAWLKGEDFGGGEVEWWSRFCEYHELVAKQRGVPTDLRPDAELDPAAFDLVRPDPTACCLWIEDRHDYWCERVRDWVSRLGEEPRRRALLLPAIEEVRILATSRAGEYRPDTHGVMYSLPYAMSQPDYERTVQHEVCHAFAKAVTGRDPQNHGETFQMLMRLACDRTDDSAKCLTYHSYNVQRAIELGKAARSTVLAAVKRGELPAYVRP